MSTVLLPLSARSFEESRARSLPVAALEAAQINTPPLQCRKWPTEAVKHTAQLADDASTSRS